MSEDVRFSRPQTAADRLNEQALDAHRFRNKRVLLTGESAVLETENGCECLIVSLRLLLRICRDVTVVLPPASARLCADLEVAADGVEPQPAIEVMEGRPLDAFDAILSVGTQSQAELPWTVINSCGWLARVSSGPTSLAEDCRQTNVMGSLAAACLGVAEVFKRLVRLRECRGRLLDGMTWSLWSYATEVDPGPVLPAALPVNLLLIGGGAIGNGVLHLLRGLPVNGCVWVVDPQRYGEENIGTCLLVGQSQENMPKAKFAEQILAGRVSVTGYVEDVATFQLRLGKEIPYPMMVLAALDNIAARHVVQDLWPDVIIDGAIGDFISQVVVQRWGEDGACLRCLYRAPAGEAADVAANRATGLLRHRIVQPGAIVNETDVASAPQARQEWLRARVGQTVCSVVQEGVAGLIGEHHQEAFAPSVPFVACMSAAMMVAEWVKLAAKWPTWMDTRYQLDLLRGPNAGQMVPQSRRPDCVCTSRAHNIDRWRQGRFQEGAA